MGSFGIHWPIENFTGQLTETENKYLEVHRKKLDPYPDILDLLFWLCVNSKAKNVVEIGVGHSTTALLLAAKRNGGMLFSTDIGTQFSLDVKEGDGKEVWTWKGGIDSIDMGKLWDVTKQGYIDFLYLDSSHAYENTLQELRVWTQHMKIGGWFLCHDVNSGIHTVFRAIADYIIEVNNVNIEYHHYPERYGFGLLIKRK